MPLARYVLTHPDRTESTGECEITVDPAFVMVRRSDGSPLIIPHEQVVSLSGADYALTFDLDDGATLRLAKLGHMHGDLLKKALEARNDAWERGLFLHGVRRVDAFATEIVSEAGNVPAEVRLYEDRLSVLPEAGDPFGVPYALVRRVDFDPDSYRVPVSTDSDPIVFGMLKQRTTEFARLLTDLIAASRARTATLLVQHLPDVPAPALTEISMLMGDGIAARREDIDRLAPGAWQRLESLVTRDEGLQEAYEFLAAQSSKSDLALGIKQSRGTGEESPETEEEVDEPEAPTAGADAGSSTLVTWFFCPIPRGHHGFIAQEITSEPGHATYFFRVPGHDWKGALAGLNRAMLSLNFKRRPIYEDGEQSNKYGFAVKRLAYLRDLRTAFAGRAIHTSFEAWKTSVEQILSSRQ